MAFIYLYVFIFPDTPRRGTSWERGGAASQSFKGAFEGGSTPSSSNQWVACANAGWIFNKGLSATQNSLLRRFQHAFRICAFRISNYNKCTIFGALFGSSGLTIDLNIIYAFYETNQQLGIVANDAKWCQMNGVICEWMTLLANTNNLRVCNWWQIKPHWDLTRVSV